MKTDRVDELTTFSDSTSIIDFESAYNDLKEEYQDLKTRKEKIILIRDEKIKNQRNQIDEMESENEKKRSLIEEKDEKIKNLNKLMINANKSKMESEAIIEDCDKRIQEMKNKWKSIEVDDLEEGISLSSIRVKKCICAYKIENELFKEKINHLEECIKNLESEKELLYQMTTNKENQNRFWSPFNYFFPKKEIPKEISHDELEILGKIEENIKHNMTKLITLNNREKENLQRKAQEKLQKVAEDLKESKKCCSDLEHKIKEMKEDGSLKMISRSDEQEKIDELNKTIESRDKNISNLEVERNKLEKKIGFLEMEVDQQTMKVEDLQKYISRLDAEDEEKKTAVALEAMGIPIENDLIIPTNADALGTVLDYNEQTFCVNCCRHIEGEDLNSHFEKCFKNEIEVTSEVIFKDETDDGTADDDDYQICPNCNNIMPKNEIESHFETCVESD